MYSKTTNRKSINRVDSNALRFSVESLEDRTLLAGVVSANVSAAGTLTLSGDADNNNVVIFIAPSGTATVAATDGGETLIRHPDGTLSAEFSPDAFVDNIRVNLRNGDDWLQVISSVPLGTVSVIGGGGDDQLSIDVHEADSVRYVGGSGNDYLLVERTTSTGNFSLLGGGGNDEVYMHSNNEFFGNTTIVGGSGNDDTTIRDSRFVGNTRVSLGSGNDDLDVESSQFNALNFSAGGGSDTARISNSIADDALFNLGSGNDQFFISTAGFMKTYVVNMGGGSDWLEANDVDGFGAFNGGGGIDTLVPFALHTQTGFEVVFDF